MDGDDIDEANRIIQEMDENEESPNTNINDAGDMDDENNNEELGEIDGGDAVGEAEVDVEEVPPEFDFEAMDLKICGFLCK